MKLIDTFDYTILSFLHHIATLNRDVFYAIAKFFSFFGSHGGLGLIVICLILLISKKTRKLGVCGLIAMGIGALITNVWLKNMIARERPYNAGIKIYHDWWLYVGATLESERYSFPSGHTTATMSLISSLYFQLDDRRAWPLFLFVIVMALSRNYLMVHYPTDVIAGMVVGMIAGLLGIALVDQIEKRFLKL